MSSVMIIHMVDRFCTILNLINGRLHNMMNPIERVENPDLLQPNTYINNKNSNNVMVYFILCFNFVQLSITFRHSISATSL